MGFHTGKMADALKDQIVAVAGKYLDGAEEDLKRFALEIAQDGAEATMIQDPVRREKVLSELVAQSRALGEVMRITANGAGWDLFQDVLHMTFRGAVAAILAVG